VPTNNPSKGEATYPSMVSGNDRGINLLICISHYSNLPPMFSMLLDTSLSHNKCIVGRCASNVYINHHTTASIDIHSSPVETDAVLF